MQNLKVIENELIPVYETDTGEKVVYGSELYENLGSKRQYTDWIKRRLRECDAIEQEDYQSISQNSEKPSGGRPKLEYIIKLDTAKEMAMLERNAKGKQVRRYFIQVEKKYKASGQVMSQSNQTLLEIFQKFMQTQTEFMEKQAVLNHRIAEKMESIEMQLPRNRIADFSYMEKEISARDRKNYLYGLVEENAVLRNISVNNFLHVMYGEIEREFDVNLNSYRMVYRSEMGKPEACMMEVIVANDRFYKLAVSLSEFMIKDYKEQAALEERMKKFKE